MAKIKKECWIILLGFFSALGAPAVAPAASLTSSRFSLYVNGNRIGNAHIRRSGDQGRTEYIEQVNIATLSGEHRNWNRFEFKLIRHHENGTYDLTWNIKFGIETRRWQGTYDPNSGHFLVTDTMTHAYRELATAPDTCLLNNLELSKGSISRSCIDPITPRISDFNILSVDDAGGMPRSSNSTSNQVILGSNGEMKSRITKALGTTIEWKPCDTDCNSDVIVPYDPLPSQLVNSPFRIPKSAQLGPIRYVITRPNRTPPPLPSNSEQSSVVSDNAMVVTICPLCAESDQVISKNEIKLYTEPNMYVQSDSPRIRQFASRIGVLREVSVDEVMTRLTTHVARHMNQQVDSTFDARVEYLGYADAETALRTGAGDCTEYAVLLAAAGRARGIATRVVYGLVYASRFNKNKNVFTPHAWVQAWLGNRWKSYDAGMGNFDATHIALSIGDGMPEHAAPRLSEFKELKIEKMGLVSY